MAKNKFSKNFYKNNYEFIDSATLNNETFQDYLYRLRKLALSRFKWTLPKSMNEIWLEKSLYEFGMASFLKDKNYGLINTKCCSSGDLNIYGLPTRLNCYSFEYQTIRKLYTGLEGKTEAQIEYLENSEAILVPNNWDFIPTESTLLLYAYRLYQADRTCDVNIGAMRTPVLILVPENQKLAMENLYVQYEGNRPVIFGDKDSLSPDSIRSIKTEAPFIADKIMDYKKKIWNEALTFLGINNIQEDKKERLITDEANQNNEVINLNLQSYLEPRQEACRQFNEKFRLAGTDKEIKVQLASDLHNLIKENESIVLKYKENDGGEENE